MAGSSTAATPPNADRNTWSVGHVIFHEPYWPQIRDSQDENFKHANLRFLRLEVSPENMSDLTHLQKKVTGELRNYVQHIWLNTAFHEHECECHRGEAGLDYDNPQAKLFQQAILQLFYALEHWEAPCPNGNGIAIELSAQLYSYKAHFNFDKSYLGSRDEIGARLTPEVHQELDMSAFADYTKRIHKHMTFRLRPDRGLPMLPAVTKFVLRRHFRHSLVCPPQNLRGKHIGNLGLRAILRKLPNLESLVYEPWRAWNDEDQLLSDQEYRLFLSHLSEKVKNISVYEDNNESYAKRIAGVDGLLRVRNTLLGQAFARASQNLERLSVAFMVEAEDFFELCIERRRFKWPHLKSLTLTSRLLAHNDHNAISDMLKKAANVAGRMKYLKTMAVWFGAEQKAFCFAYHQRSGNSGITWQGTELLADDPELIQSWAKVAEIHGASFHGFKQKGLSDIRWKLGSPCFAGLKEELMLAQGLKSHGHAAFLLGDNLPGDVIDPLSLWQMQQEARVL